MTYSLLGFDAEGSQVQVSQSSRREGMYLIGATGTGKSTLIENLAIEDAKNGLGVCVIDPHGDVTNAIISRMVYLSKHDPKERVRELFTQRLEKDVILIDLASREYVAPFNLFHCEDSSDPFEVENVVSAFMHILESVYQISPLTPQMNQYFTAIAHTLIYNPTYTLLDIDRLLTDKPFRQKLVANIPDAHVKWFWNVFFEDYRKGIEQGRDISSVVNKLDEFIKPVMKPWFGTIQKTLNFRQLMDEEKLVFIKLNSQWGNLTKLIGNIVIAQLLDAAYSRNNIPVKKRRQMNIYVDEFQKFASEDFATLFTEARKFGLGLTISHQVISQVPDKIKETCEQAANIVVFKVSANNAEELAGVFDTTPPPGEPIREQVMEEETVQQTITKWTPPESEQEYNLLEEKLRKVKLEGAILLSAAFGPPPITGRYDSENVIQLLELKSKQYDTRQYALTKSFINLRSLTTTTLEGKTQEYKVYVDPLHDPLVTAFTPNNGLTYREERTDREGHIKILKRLRIQEPFTAIDATYLQIRTKEESYTALLKRLYRAGDYETLKTHLMDSSIFPLQYTFFGKPKRMGTADDLSDEYIGPNTIGQYIDEQRRLYTRKLEEQVMEKNRQGRSAD